jgi:hypothetical protein
MLQDFFFIVFVYENHIRNNNRGLCKAAALGISNIFFYILFL